MITTAYILAAGKGTRLYPFSNAYPKSMLPLINKPILFHSIESVLKAGITNIGIVVPIERSWIMSQVESTFPDLDIRWVVQEIPLGTSHAILQVEEELKGKNFVVIAGDSLFHASFLRNLGTIHLKDRNWVTLSLEKMDFELMRASSTVDYRDGCVWGVREKPRIRDEIFSEFSAAACYAFSRSIFPFLRRVEKSIRKEYELAPAINEIIRSKHRVGGVKTDRVCHISTPFDLWWFNLQFLQDSKLKDSKGNLIGKEVSYESDVSITNSVIGDYTTVQDGCYEIRNSVILPHTELTRNCKNVLAMSDHYQQFS
jgi:glucose-1-phosphate thymidylyltransferase